MSPPQEGFKVHENRNQKVRLLRAAGQKIVVSSIFNYPPTSPSEDFLPPPQLSKGNGAGSEELKKHLKLLSLLLITPKSPRVEKREPGFPTRKITPAWEAWGGGVTSIHPGLFLGCLYLNGEPKPAAPHKASSFSHPATLSLFPFKENKGNEKVLLDIKSSPANSPHLNRQLEVTGIMNRGETLSGNGD